MAIAVVVTAFERAYIEDQFMLLRLAGQLGAAPLALLLTLWAPSEAVGQAPSYVDSALLRPLRQHALAASPLVAARRAALAAAEARVATAGLLAPAIASGEMDEVPGFDVAAASFRVEVSREIAAGGRRSATRNLAVASVEAAAIALRATERAVEARVSAALTRTAAADAISRRLAAEDSLLAGAEDAVRSRFSLGEARYVDVLRLRTERLRVQTEQAQAGAEARSGRGTMVALVSPERDVSAAILVDSLLRLAARPGALDVPAAPPSLDSLLAASGIVQAAAAAARRSRAGRALLLAEQRPRFEVSAGVERFGSSEGGGGTLGPVLGVSVTLPFTARRGNHATALVAEREVQTAEAISVAALAEVRARLEAALTMYEAARARVATFDTAVLRGAREERESALASYRAGDLSLLELLDFERALARAEIERLHAMSEAAAALAELHAGATGDVSVDDLISFNENR